MIKTRQNEETRWLHAVCDAMPDAVLAVNSRGHVVMCSRKSTTILGLPATRIHNANISSLLKLSNTKDGARIRLPSPGFFLDHSAPVFITACMLERKTSSILVDVVLAPMHDDTGTPGGTLVLVRDVSGKTASEQKAINNERISVMGSLADEIAQTLASASDILAGNAARLADSLVPKTRTHERVLKIIAASGKIEALLKRLRSISDAGKPAKKIPAVPVSLYQIVKTASTFMGDSMGEHKIKLDIPSDDNGIKAVAAPDHLVDCIIEIIQNSTDAMQSGGKVTITISRKKTNAGKFAVIKITDNGCGMTKESLQKIFEPFFTTKSAGGTGGLGMTLLNSLVKKMNGFLKISSKPGMGTSISIFLPEAFEPDLDKAHGKRNNTVMVLDDNEHILSQISNMLEEKGFKVVTARNGTDFTKLIEKKAPSVKMAIIDAIIPGSDTVGIVESVTSKYPSIPVMLSSGFSREYLRGRIGKSHWGYLQKPFDKAQLFTSMERTVKNHAGLSV